MSRNAKQLRKKALRDNLESVRPENMQHPEERLLPPAFLETLRRHGLDVGDFPFFFTTHMAYPSGYPISLPQSSGGNGFPGYEVHFTDHCGLEQISHMPTLRLWGEAGHWNVEVRDYVPGPGPGDFRKIFVSLDDALRSILSYFFDPEDDHFGDAQRDPRRQPAR
jgi:hypothetical protein